MSQGKIDNILSNQPANIKTMNNGDMITHASGKNLLSYLKHNNEIYTLKWIKESERVKPDIKKRIIRKDGNELKTSNYKRNFNGFKIDKKGSADFKNLKTRGSINDLQWRFFTGTTPAKDNKIDIEHGVINGKKRIVCVSMNMASDLTSNVASGSIPNNSFIAGAANIQDEADIDREYETYYDDTNVYLKVDADADDIESNQFTCAVFYVAYDLY